MELMTTQMRDFVPKPFSKPQPMMQGSAIPRECAPLESNTINRLSFMPIDVCKFRPARPFIPVQNEQKSLGPVSDCTTYKLSYMPCAPLPKEPTPWVNESCYVKPTQPMETCKDQTELILKVTLFLFRIHHKPITSNHTLLTVIQEIINNLQQLAVELRDMIGINYHAFQLIQQEIEEKEGVELFKDATKAKKQRDKKLKRREISKRIHIQMS